jgi:hypothetical protein
MMIRYELEEEHRVAHDAVRGEIERRTRLQEQSGDGDGRDVRIEERFAKRGEHGSNPSAMILRLFPGA